MTKKVVITGQGKTVDLLCGYLCARMAEIEIYRADLAATEDDLCEKTKFAEVVILLHEIDKNLDAESSFKFTMSVLSALIKNDAKAAVAYFAPKKSATSDSEGYAIKLRGEAMLREYQDAGEGSIVLYRLPQIFGPSCDNEIMDRIISKRSVETPEQSYEFIHIDGLAEELYRMINGVPGKTGFDRYAVPGGAFFATEGTILKKITAFDSLAPCEIPDFPSSFDRMLYDYYLGKKGVADEWNLGSVEKEVPLIKSKRFGTVSVKHLSPSEQFLIRVGGASGVRLYLLCGTVKTQSGSTYSAESNIIRIDLYDDTMVENIGNVPAVIQIWNHNSNE